MSRSRDLLVRGIGKMYKIAVRQAMLHGTETVAVTCQNIEKRLVAELKMVSWALRDDKKR